MRRYVTGAVTGVNKYDPYGEPDAGNTGLFQYTGQIWLAEAGLYHYKARAYSPALGRFLETDPIGFAGGMNIYAYAGNDPVNATDPSGLTPSDEVVSYGTRHRQDWGFVYAPVGGYATPGFSGGLGEAGEAAGGGDGKGKNDKQQCPPGHPPNKPPAEIPAFVNTGTVAALERNFGATSAEGAEGAAGAEGVARLNPLVAVLSLFLAIPGDTTAVGRGELDVYRHYGFSADAGKFADGLRPGSFATTSVGPPLTGLQAQQLLALPHPTPPDSFYNVTIVRGSVPVIGPTIVQPENGQPGGGIEFLFPEGTPPGSVTGPFPTPKDCDG